MNLILEGIPLMTRRIDWLLWSALAMIAVPASAHPGHGTTADSSSLTHYVTDPMHGTLLVAVLIAAIAVGAWIVRLIGARAERDA